MTHNSYATRTRSLDMVRCVSGNPGRNPDRFEPEWEPGPVRPLSANPDRILDLLVGEKPSGVKSRTDALGPPTGGRWGGPLGLSGLVPPPRRASMESRSIRLIPG